MVEHLGRTTFSARIELHADTVTKAGSLSAKLTTSQIGVISGQDLDLTIDTTAEGVKRHARIVALGDQVYASADDGPWQVSRRSQVQVAIDQILREARRTVSAGQLADLGEETVEGQAAHHLTLTAPFTFDDPVLGTIEFDAYDLWATPDGTPILRKQTLHASSGSTTSTGTSETQFRDVGATPAIVAPALPPSAAPS